MRWWTTWNWQQQPEEPWGWADAADRLVLVEPDLSAPWTKDGSDIGARSWLAMRKSKAVFVVRTRHPDMVPSQTMKTVGDTVALVPAELAPNIVLAGHVHAQAELDDARLMHLPHGLLGSPSIPEPLVPKLLSVRSACHAIWLEPMDAIDLSKYLTDPHCARCRELGDFEDERCEAGQHDMVAGGIRWVICRGGSDPVHPVWVNRIRQACRAAEVPFSFLGWGDWQIGSTLGREPDAERVLLSTGRLILPHRVHEDTTDDERCGWPLMRAEMVARVGAERSGRLIDGKVVDERPELAR